MQTRTSLHLRQISWLTALVAGLSAGHVLAAPSTIFTCTDGQGRKLTSDRPIQECLDREQRILNRDGSLRQLVPPRMNAEERAAFEEQRRLRLAQEVARKDAARRDRNLMQRFPSQVVHDKARESALDDVRKALALSEKRIAELDEERKGLLDEAEFYKNRRLPAALRVRLEDNDATTQAQSDLIESQKIEMVRINALFDAELRRLRALWNGAPPGSPLDEPSPATPQASASSASR